jgi:hypothetical protein
MKLVDLLIILVLSLWFIDLGPLGLYKEIDDARPRARDSCTSYATENTDYLTHPLSFELFEVKANHLLVPVNVSIEP